MQVLSGVIWAIKMLCGAVVVALAAGIVIITVGVAVEAVWVLRYENWRKHKDEREEE